MSIFLTDPLIDSLRPKPPEEPEVPDYGGQDYPTPQPMATPDYGGQDYPSFPQAQVQQARQLGTYAPEAAPSTYDYTPQPQPSFYQPGGAVGDVFSGLGSAVSGLGSSAYRRLVASGQRQLDAQESSGLTSEGFLTPRAQKEVDKRLEDADIPLWQKRGAQAAVSPLSIPFGPAAYAGAVVGGGLLGALEMTPLEESLKDAPWPVKVGVGIMVAGATFAATKNPARAAQVLEQRFGPTVATALARGLPWAAAAGAGAIGTVEPYEAIKQVVGIGSMVLAQKAGAIVQELGAGVRFSRVKNPSYRVTGEPLELPSGGGAAAAAEPEFIDVFLDPRDGVYKAVKDFVPATERRAAAATGQIAAPAEQRALAAPAEQRALAAPAEQRALAAPAEQRALAAPAEQRALAALPAPAAAAAPAARPPEAAAPAEAAAQGARSFADEPFSQSYEELTARASTQQMSGKALEESLFGRDGAAEYARLQRIANSSTASRDVASAAYRQAEAMERTLSPAQQNRLFGIGETGYNQEELTEFARAAAPRTGDTPASLIRTVSQNLYRVRPDDMRAFQAGERALTSEQQIAAMRVREAIKAFVEQGGTPDAIYAQAISKLGREIDPADAAYLMREWIDLTTAARPPGAVPPGGGGTVPPAGSGAPPPIPPSPPSPPSGSTTPEPIQALVDLLVPGEKPGLGILRLYEGAINTQGLVIRRDLNAGNRSLASLKIGRPTAQSRLVQKSPEIEQLFLALHGEAQVPPRLQGVFDTLKEQVAVETAATVGFDPKFMAHPDYFPRGWRTVEVEPANASRARSMGAGSLGSTPGFSKPRVDATFSEILGSIYTRDNGSVYRLEPQSWNPFEQMAIRRVAGTEFREQSILIDRLKQSGTAVVADGPLPEGYRVPRVGAAFEGKPKIALGVDGEPASFYGYTDRYAVEDKIANVLENIYGRRVSLGRGPDAILSAMQLGKRAKLMGSLFQQVDFITRTGFASFGGALDDLISGKPVNAVIKVAKFPVEAGKVVAANLSPARRNLLRNEILSGNAIFPDRPGITLKGVSEAGWNQADITIVRRDINQAFTDSVGDEALTGTAMRNLRRLEAANQRGLFDGVYPQAQTTALKNWVLPRLMRQHPDWTDAQIMGQAADEINKAFSTLGDYQTIFKNPYVQHLTHNLIFSTGEPEALIRGAGSIFVGNNKRLWATYYLGGFVFLAATANLIHMASTALMGNMETLPVMRYNPLKIDQNAPFNLKYNTRFLSPDTPIPGEGGVRTAMDLVGQMDTALRLLNPLEFLTSRLNVGPRAIQNQISGTDYYGNRIDTVGPKGIVSRALQFATDLYEPITANQIRTQVISPKGIREPVGRIGGAVQAAGINLRPESPSAAVDRGDFESLSGEAQLQGLRRKTWNEVKYLEGEDAPASFYEWYKKESEAQIERFSEYGFNPLEALSLAEKNMQKNDLAKLYRAKHNNAENEWAVTNPRLAYEILLREKDLKFYEKTFSPSPGVRKFVGFASQSDDEGN